MLRSMGVFSQGAKTMTKQLTAPAHMEGLTIAESIYWIWRDDYAQDGVCIEWMCLASAVRTDFDSWDVPTYVFKDGSSISTEGRLIYVGEPIDPTV